MKKITLSISFCLSCWSMMFAQEPANLISSQVAYSLHEKIKNPYFDEIVAYMQAHPGELPDLTHLVPVPAPNSGADRSEEVLVHDDEKAESELHAAMNPTDTNNIIVSPIIQDPSNFLSPIDVPIYYTLDFGQTWNTSNIVFNPDPNAGFTAGGGDPLLAFDNNGRAYISWLALTFGFGTPPLKLTLYLATSEDKGQTWSDPLPIAIGTGNLDLGTGALTGSLVDKQWMVADQTSSAYSGNLYVSYTELNQVSATEGTARILVKTLPAGTDAFGPEVQVHTSGNYIFMQFSSIDVDPEGQVHVSFVATEPSGQVGIYHAVSTDGGQTFSPEVKVSNLYYPPGNGGTLTNGISGIDDARLYPCPHIRAGKSAGLLYLTWTANGITAPETEGYDIYFSKSEDHGATWTLPVTINQGENTNAEQYYNAINVNPDGTLCLAYYDRSDDPDGTNTHHVVSFSYDQGESFTPIEYASNEASDFGLIGSLNGNFGIGEYTHILATNYNAIPIWADGRGNNGDIDIFAAIIPINDPFVGIPEIGHITDKFSVMVHQEEPGRIGFDIFLKVDATLAWTMLNLEGKVLASYPPTSDVSAGTYRFNLDVPAGIYFLKVETGLGWKTVRVVVN